MNIKKVTVITPSFNDCETITETLNSFANQSYKNKEMIIVDDGSTDNTRKLVEDFISSHNLQDVIKYVYEENKDQLNAIGYGLEFATGEYCFFLHSDDMFFENDTLLKCVEYMEHNQNLDAIIADLCIINEKSEITGQQKVKEYNTASHILPLQELWLGRNLFVDVAFYKMEILRQSVKYTYLTWNMPFWMQINQNNIGMLNVNKADFIMLKYRVHGGNYINNEKGRLNVINGELRTLVTLMSYYNIPFYSMQYYLFRTCNKLNIEYKPFYIKKEQQHKGRIVEFVVKKRFDNEYIRNNLFLNALISFYKANTNRIIEVESINENDVYYGKDMRAFNTSLLDGSLSSMYITLFKEMRQGFNEIKVNEKDYDKMVNITKFLCIYPFVKIVKK